MKRAFAVLFFVVVAISIPSLVWAIPKGPPPTENECHIRLAWSLLWQVLCVVAFKGISYGEAKTFAASFNRKTYGQLVALHAFLMPVIMAFFESQHDALLYNRYEGGWPSYPFDQLTISFYGLPTVFFAIFFLGERWIFRTAFAAKKSFMAYLILFLVNISIGLVLASTIILQPLYSGRPPWDCP